MQLFSHSHAEERKKDHTHAPLPTPYTHPVTKKKNPVAARACGRPRQVRGTQGADCDGWDRDVRRGCKGTQLMCAFRAPPSPPPPPPKLAQPPANTKPPNRCRRRIGRPAAMRTSRHCPSDTPIPPICHTHSSHMSRPTPRKCRIRFVSDHLSMYIVQIRNEYEQACARSRHYILERLVAPRLSPPLQAPAQRREGSSARSVRARWCQSLKRSPSVKSSARCMAQWRQSSGTIWYSSISGRRSEMIRR